MDEKYVRGCLRLLLADGVGAVRFARLVEAFGSVAAAGAAGNAKWQRVEGIGPKIAQALAAVTHEDIDAELAEVEKHGVDVLTLTDPRYPAGLKEIPDAPPLLYVRGRLTQTDAVAMAIVGARRCTHYGVEQAERFGQLLGQAGFTVVSGGARGIDTAAHRGALSVGGRTIAVMGCGLCMSYPSENEKMFERIVADDRGALVSELPMRRGVEGRNFPKRNRIISGLSLGALVVEAARRSGSLITARVADEQGRALFALPGRVDSPQSQGANELIRDGAILVQNLDDILEQLGEVGEKMTPDSQEIHPPRPPAVLDDVERRLVAALDEGPRTLDELARRTGLASGRVASAMTMLVLKSVVAQRPGNVFAKK